MTLARLYDKSMYEFQKAQPSLWEATAGECVAERPPLQTDKQCEVAVIGGGYTGLSAAYHLGKSFGIDTCVLEAGHIGWGASGRNGGFCSIGGAAADTDALVRRYGLGEVRRYFRSQIEAVRLVADLLREEGIDAQLQGDAELTTAHSRRAFETLKAKAERNFRYLGLDMSVLARREFAERYFDSAEQHGGSILRPTFGLHPLRFQRGLADAAARHGATLHAHSEVAEWRREGARHRLITATGSVSTRFVVFATNAFMPEHLHTEFHGRPLPLISAIVVTEPLTPQQLAAHSWHTESPAINTRHLMNYFRLLPDRRFMFGGRGHATGTVAGTAANFTHLTDRLHRIWPHWRTAAIDYRWHGLVCYTRRKTPAIGRLESDPRVFYAFGYHGNGVNTAVWAGQKLAGWLAGSGSTDSAATSLPAMVQGLPAKIPMSRWRVGLLGLRLGWMGLRDRLGL